LASSGRERLGRGPHPRVADRPDSLKAVRLLEKCLDLPEESLIVQLGPRRPRGRWLSQPPGTIEVDRLAAEGVSVAKMVGELDRWMYHELTRLSLHDVYTVGAGRDGVSQTCRQVLRANTDRVSRTFGIFSTDDPSAIPAIRAIRNCRIGRARSDPVRGCWPRRSSSTGCWSRMRRS
jgi:hypothetical protein